MKILVLILVFSGLAGGSDDAWEYWMKSLDRYGGGGEEGGGDGEGSAQGEWPTPDDGPAQGDDVTVPTLEPYQLQASCDRIMTLYVNGKQVAFSLSWAQITEIELPEEALVAIKCKELGNSAGIIAKFTPELPENNNWLCSRTRSTDWFSDAFGSEGSWNEPVSVEHPSLVSIPNNHWFWLPRQRLSRFSDIYCRIKLDKRVPLPPPRPGGPRPRGPRPGGPRPGGPRPGGPRPGGPRPGGPRPGGPRPGGPRPVDMDELNKLFKLRPTLNYIFSALYKINRKLDNLPDQITYDLKYPKRQGRGHTGSRSGVARVGSEGGNQETSEKVGQDGAVEKGGEGGGDATVEKGGGDGGDATVEKGGGDGGDATGEKVGQDATVEKGGEDGGDATVEKGGEDGGDGTDTGGV